MDMPAMDMSGNGPNTHAGGMSMPTYFTASLPTGPLWFYAWQPTTAGTTFLACLGLFGLTVVLKLLGAVRNQTNIAWSTPPSGRHDTTPIISKMDKSESSTMTGSLRHRNRQHKQPWIAEHEIPRGFLAAVHIGLEYFLMLIVMTYNAYFFIAIVLGHFAGEVAFGRWGTGGGHA